MPSQCPVCGHPDPVAFDVARTVPIMMNRVYATQAQARQCSTGTLELQRCSQCGFAWNKAFDAARIEYDETYENDQAHSPAFRAHLEARALEVLAAVEPDEDVRMLEVGCGQGGFLALVRSLCSDRPWRGVGYDPAFRAASLADMTSLRVVPQYFSPDSAGELEMVPNVVVSRHTIEHIPEPVSFLSSVHAALGHDSSARIFLETPCVDWIVRNEAYQDFFYEHCSLFSPEALAHALEAAGFVDIVIDHCFGGQYLWASAAAGGLDAASRRARAADTKATPHEGNTVDAAGFVAHWQKLVNEAAKAGPVAVWGAGAKGVTFANLLDLGRLPGAFLVDINPAKQGRFAGLSGLPIVAPHDQRMLSARTVFVMNPNYLDEVRAIVERLNPNATLIPLIPASAT